MKTLFRCRFGSHLYGTNTPFSDYDEKGVFLESLENIVLGRSSKTKRQTTSNDRVRNQAGDEDYEYKELRSFLKEAMDGQTYALDMLFCNSENTLETSSEWQFIQSNRSKLVSKNVKPFIGYCRQQAGKYGLKGSRLGDLERVLMLLKAYEQDQPLSQAFVPESEFVKYYSDGKVDYLEVLGKKYQVTTLTKRVLESLRLLHSKYGERSKLAQENEGVDWKAVSHAYRCMFEVKRLLETGEIVFPLPEREYVLKVKRGELSWPRLNEELPVLMDELEKLAVASSLPDQPDRKFWDGFILETYLCKKSF